MAGPAGFGAVEAVRHGGRLSAAERAYPQAPRPWLDLSTGINPDFWPGPAGTLETLRRLPDPQALARLEQAAAAAFGADPASVAATAGSEAGLRLLPQLIEGARVDVVGPTYASHAQAWRLAGREVQVIAADAAPTSRADVLVLVNPNNPDGRIWTSETLAALAQGRRLVVDEAFGETAPALSAVGLGLTSVVVLRSFGKFYGLPGARLGFLVAAPELTARARALQGDWPVSGEALALGAGAYADVAWRKAMTVTLAAGAAHLDADLAAAGLGVVGGTSLFRLVSTPDAGRVFERLCRLGILTRPFADRPDWLRFGLPPEGARDRLRAALLQALS